jgi:hypothetical protein
MTDLIALEERRLEFPGGYFDCCGMSRARGHAGPCHRNVRPPRPRINGDRNPSW